MPPVLQSHPGVHPYLDFLCVNRLIGHVEVVEHIERDDGRVLDIELLALDVTHDGLAGPYPYLLLAQYTVHEINRLPVGHVSNIESGTQILTGMD